MGKVTKFIDRISELFGRIAGIMMLVSIFLVLAEVLVRTLFSKTLYITQEYSGYLMVGMTFLGLAYTLKERGHIRVVFLHKLVKGKYRALLDIYAFTVGLIIFAVITKTTGSFFWDSVVSQTRSMQISETYLAIPQFLMPLGSLIMALQFLSEILHAILRFRSGEVDLEEVESEALGH